MSPRHLGPYALQLRRVLVLTAAFVAVFITIISGPQLIPPCDSPPEMAQWAVYSPNLGLPLAAGLFALVAAATAVATRARARTWADTGWFALVRLYLVCYLLLVVACAALPSASLSSPIPSEYLRALVSATNPVLALYPLAALCCAAVLEERHTVAYLCAIAPLQILALMEADPGNGLPQNAIGPLYFLLFSMLNAGTLHWAMRIAHDLDRTRLNTREAQRALANERARGRARARSNGLIHDYVLSALVLAFNRSVEEGEVRAAADSALSALTPGPSSSGTVEAEQLLGALAAQVRPREPDWTITCRWPQEAPALPAEAGAALIDAGHEALNNVRLHAGSDASDPGRPAQCRVALVFEGGAVRVTITDTGRGFDPDRPTGLRHGIRDSIVARMEAVGGRASLASCPGGGTRVVLEWSGPRDKQATRGPVLAALARRAGRGRNRKEPSRTAWDSQVRAAAESRGARMLAVASVAVHAYITAVEIRRGAYYHPAPVVLSLALLAAAGAALVAQWPDRRPPEWVGWGSTAVVGLSNLLALTQIRVGPHWPGWSAWSAGASMFLVLLLLLRQRTAEAVAGCAALIAATAIWVAVQGREPALVFTFSLGHVVAFVFWLLLTSQSGAATTAIEEALEAEGEARLAREEQLTLNAVMAAGLADVSERARGTLEAIRDREMTPGLAMEARLLEAELRDEIRAPFFTGTAVVEAARRSRARGVEVLLLDDRGGEGPLGTGEGADDRLRALIVERAACALDEARAGRVVVRVGPTGRRWAATILSDAGLCVVKADGSVE